MIFAFHDLDHGAGDRLTGTHHLFDPAPGALVLRPLLRQDQPAFLVLFLQYEGLDLVADLHDLVRIDVVADRELLARDDAFRLVTDVQQDLVAIDLDDRAFDDVPVVEVTERFLHGDNELFRRQVALGRRRRFGGVYGNQPLPHTRRTRTGA
jgi:hypothetical protein